MPTLSVLPKGNFTFRMVVYALPSKFAYPFKALKI